LGAAVILMASVALLAGWRTASYDRPLAAAGLSSRAQLDHFSDSATRV